MCEKVVNIITIWLVSGENLLGRYLWLSGVVQEFVASDNIKCFPFSYFE